MLFRTDEELPKKQPVKGLEMSAHHPERSMGFVLGNSLEALDIQFKDLAPGQSAEFATGGKWSMHEMILYFAHKLGQSKLYLSTWALSENPVRALVMAKQEGVFSEINALFDLRIKNNQGAAFHMLTSHCNSYRLTKIHAKIAVMLGDGIGITIISSANLTENKRIEAGAVMYSLKTTLSMIDWMKREIEEGVMIPKNGAK